MCGISGIVKFDGSNVNAEDIKLMMSNMKHRGPDDEGVFFEDNIGLGFVRLSILDLTANGNQPMYSNDNRFVIIYNGEVYNYIEIRKELENKYDFRSNTDTEVVLASYLEWGKDCLDKFNGMFSFFIYDRVQKKGFAARDRYGVKPFYYYQDKYKFIFSSEIKSILPLIEKKSFNNNMIFDYAVYNRTDHTNETFYKGIFKLEHGSFLDFNKNEIKIKKWYNLSEKIFKQRKALEPESYLNLLQDSVRLRLRSDVKVGVSLSGGLDSSAITGILTDRLKQKNISSFSSSYNSTEDYDEYPFINLFSNKISDMYFTYPSEKTLIDDYKDFIYTLSEPATDIGPYIQYKVMSLVSKHVKVVLGGQGADEQLGGYHNFFGSYYKELLSQFKLFKLFNEIIAYKKIHNTNEALQYFIYYLLPIALKKRINPFNLGSVNKDFFKNYSKSSSVVKNIYHPENLQSSLVEHFENKLEHLLKWDDLNSMRFSVESRVPFLDYRLVEATLNMPSDSILKNATTKFILRKSIRKIVPKKIVNRIDKKGFSNPRAQWYRSKIFRLFINDMLNSSQFLNLGIFDVKSAKIKYAKHCNFEADYSSDIWKWINLYELKNQFQ